MKHDFHPHWTQPLVHWRLLLFLPPVAETVRRRSFFALPLILILLCMLWMLYLPRLFMSESELHFCSLLRSDRFHNSFVLLETHRSLPMRLLGGVPLRLHNVRYSVPRRRSLVLSVPEAHRLHRFLSPPMVALQYIPPLWTRLLSAAFQPHLTAGWALTFPFLRRLDDARVSSLLHTLLPSGASVWAKLPAPWILLTTAVLIGWFVAFLRRLEESACSRIYRGHDTAAIRCGLLTRRTRVFFLRRCLGTELQQNLGLYFFGIASLALYTGQPHPALLLPAASAKSVVSALTAQLRAPVHVFSPPEYARSRFGRVELYLLTALIPFLIWVIAHELFVLQYVLTAIGLVLCLRLWAQQLAFDRTAVQLGVTHLLVCRCKGLAIVTTFVPRAGVAAVSVRANWFQRRIGLCTLWLHVPGLPVLKVKHLRLRDGFHIQRELCIK